MKTPRKWSGLWIAVSVILAVAGTAPAGNLYWSGDGASQGGTGIWNTNNASWSSSGSAPFSTVWNNGNNDTAIFAGPFGTVTLGTNVQVGGLQFSSSGYTIDGSYTLGFGVASGITNNIGSITFGNGLSVTNMGPITIGNDDNGNTISIISGSTLRLNNSSILIGNGNGNVYNNSLIVNGGTLTNVNSIGIGQLPTGGADIRDNSLVITNGSRVFVNGAVNVAYTIYSINSRTLNSNSLVIANGGYLSSVGGGCVPSTSWASGQYNAIQVRGGIAASTWNVRGGDFQIGAGSYNTITIDGAGSAGGALVTNAGLVYLQGTANSLTLTNGAQMFSTNTVTIGNGANNNTYTIAGGAATSILSGGGSSIYIGNNGNRNKFMIGAGGVVTNVSLVYSGWLSDGNQLSVTDGGQLFTSGSIYLGNGSTGINGGSIQNSNSMVIANGGVARVGGGMNVGYYTAGYDFNTASFNNLTITNGGQLFTTGHSYIGGRSTMTGGYTDNNDNNNSVIIGGSLGSTNALWDLGNQDLYIGLLYVSANTATGNALVVTTGGVVTNAGSIHVNSLNQLGGGGGTIHGNVAYSNGAAAVFMVGNSPLTFTGTVTLNSNTVHLVMPDKCPAGSYHLAVNTGGGFSGSFAAAPVVDSGSINSQSTNIITTATDVWLIAPGSATVITIR